MCQKSNLISVEFDTTKGRQLLNLGHGKSQGKSWNFERSSVPTLAWELNKFYTHVMLRYAEEQQGTLANVNKYTLYGFNLTIARLHVQCT